MARRPTKSSFPGRKGRSDDKTDTTPGGRRGRSRRHGEERDFPGTDRDGRGGKGPKGRMSRKGPASRTQGEEAPRAGEKSTSFSHLLMAKARAAHPDLVGPPSSPEPLARLKYEDELELKNQALQEFWTKNDIPDKPNRILPSPRPRKYRTTTKRRVVFEHGRFRLDFQPEKREAGQARLGAVSELEPAEHGALYAFLLEKLNTPAYAVLGQALNFLVIRGDYRRFAVFFNVSRVNAEVARKAKLLADHLQHLELGADGRAVEAPADAQAPAADTETGPGAAQSRRGSARRRDSRGKGEDRARVASAYLFNDPGRSPFYLDDRAPEGPWKIKRLFGPDIVRLKVGERTYAFKPTAFAQVNASILPDFLDKAAQLLKPRPEQRLLDLYCGFGFFSLHLASAYREVTGVDAAGPAIESAREMASEAKTRARFLPGRIRADSLGRLLPPAQEDLPEAILLDPPRQGVEPGVIRELAARKPVRVLHVFCDMETLPREVNQWRKAGYMIAKVVPLDMFPGTDNLEVLVAFIPDRYGILNRIEAPARNALGGSRSAPEDGARPAPRRPRDNRTPPGRRSGKR